jgi:hypothetical protein
VRCADLMQLRSGRCYSCCRWLHYLSIYRCT